MRLCHMKCKMTFLELDCILSVSPLLTRLQITAVLQNCSLHAKQSFIWKLADSHQKIIKCKLKQILIVIIQSVQPSCPCLVTRTDYHILLEEVGSTLFRYGCDPLNYPEICLLLLHICWYCVTFYQKRNHANRQLFMASFQIMTMYLFLQRVQSALKRNTDCSATYHLKTAIEHRT